MTLQGKLIEIFGLNVLEPTRKQLEINPRVLPIDLNGCLGWAVEWVEEELKYRVETFHGHDLYVKEENVREYYTLPTRDGGFDIAWPAVGLEEYFGEFAQRVSEALVNQYYCMVQMMQVKENAKAALTKAYVQTDWSRIMPEFEPDFLGNGSLGKINWLPQDAGMEDGDGLSRADAMLSAIAGLLAPYTPMLGFTSGTRSAGLLRMPFEDEDEEVSLMRGVEDGQVVSGREIEGCLQFTKLRKIGLIYFLHGDGGTLRLDFKDPDKLPIEIPIEQGRVFIFRHDLLQFSYRPEGSKALALQAWIFREERPGECEILPRAASEIESWDKSMIPSPPTYGNSNQTVDCMSISCRTPGGGDQAEDYWQTMCHGVDGVIEIKEQRWDQDFYYDPNPYSPPGKMYIKHLGFVSSETWESFDADYFSMSYEEAAATDPVARKCLEVAWDCLVRGGWTADTVVDTNMAVGIGGGLMDGYQAHFLQLPGITTLGMEKHSRVDNVYLPCYKLGLRGPQMVIDTACSSALSACGVVHSLLRPQMPGQTKNNFVGQCPYGLVIGSAGVATPFFMMGLAGAGMLSHNGRCFTFDQSADGYLRGEGCSAMHFQVSNKEELTRLMALKGSCSNQDGRSASLTAPNGPSQTLCCRASMREAGNDGSNTLLQELHGTGTPLGDPIETGALQVVVMNGPDGKRVRPVVKTSSKSNVGHGEPLAGLNGIIKCTLMMQFQLAAPNLHLRALNPNVDTSGYPVLIVDERFETGELDGYCGVSSFGFSGCNARADIWGMATAGHRQAFPIGYDFGRKRHELLGEKKFPHAGITKVSSSSVGAKKLETFDGVFGSGLLNEETVLSLSGTWNAWTTMDTMDQVPEVKGDALLYQMGFRIGDTLVEEFCIHVDGYADNMIFPAVKGAGKDALVLGPGTAPKDYNWRVDGRVDGAKSGAIYVVSLWWYAETNRKRVSWELVSEKLKFSWPLSTFTHRYGVRGTWTSWYSQDLEVTGEGCYETVFRIGNTGSEEFHFVRDGDDSQLIYPTESTIAKKSVSVRGPDGKGKGKHWAVEGVTGDPVRLQLKVKDGEIVVTVILKSGTERIWKNLPPGVAGSYYVHDADGKFKQMQPSNDNPLVHKASITIDYDEGYYFQIVIDKDPSQAIYPELTGADISGLSSVLGPDALGQDQAWRILEPEGAKAEITYDPTQADSRHVVTWRVTHSSRLKDDTPIGLYREDQD